MCHIVSQAYFVFSIHVLDSGMYLKDSEKWQISSLIPVFSSIISISPFVVLQRPTEQYNLTVLWPLRFSLGDLFIFIVKPRGWAHSKLTALTSSWCYSYPYASTRHSKWLKSICFNPYCAFAIFELILACGYDATLWKIAWWLCKVWPRRRASSSPSR